MWNFEQFSVRHQSASIKPEIKSPKAPNEISSILSKKNNEQVRIPYGVVSKKRWSTYTSCNMYIIPSFQVFHSLGTKPCLPGFVKHPCPPPYAPTLLQAPRLVERVVEHRPRLPDHCNVSVEATSAAMAPEMPRHRSNRPYCKNMGCIAKHIYIYIGSTTSPPPGCQFITRIMNDLKLIDHELNLHLHFPLVEACVFVATAYIYINVQARQWQDRSERDRKSVV